MTSMENEFRFWKYRNRETDLNPPEDPMPVPIEWRISRQKPLRYVNHNNLNFDALSKEPKPYPPWDWDGGESFFSGCVCLDDGTILESAGDCNKCPIRGANRMWGYCCYRAGVDSRGDPELSPHSAIFDQFRHYKYETPPVEDGGVSKYRLKPLMESTPFLKE